MCNIWLFVTSYRYNKVVREFVLSISYVLILFLYVHRQDVFLTSIIYNKHNNNRKNKNNLSARTKHICVCNCSSIEDFQVNFILMASNPLEATTLESKCIDWLKPINRRGGGRNVAWGSLMSFSIELEKAYGREMSFFFTFLNHCSWAINFPKVWPSFCLIVLW